MKKKKTGIRKAVKKAVIQLSEDEKALQSENIFRQMEMLPEFQSAETILLYWSLPDEVSTHKFIKKWSGKKRILLPVIKDDELILKEYDNSAFMPVGKFNICEPTGEEFTDYSQINLCVIPGVAFCRSGKRLGRGKGFYDKLLPKINATKIGICFDVQMLPDMPCEAWDKKMDMVIINENK